MFVTDVLKIAVLVSSRISLKHHRLRLHTAQWPVISSSSRPISTVSANSKAPPAGRTALWAEPPGPAERKLRLAYLPELVLINSGIHIILDSLSLCSSKLSYFSTAVTDIWLFMSQRYYITLKMMHLQGSRYIKPTFFVTAIYTVHYKRSVHQQNPETAVGRSYFMELLNCFGRRPSWKCPKRWWTVL